MLQLFTKSLIAGTAVSLTTTAALALLARAEGRHPLQPVNSTSHWYLGEDAGRSRALDVPHTLGGLATHHAASAFWALAFEGVRRLRPQATPLGAAVTVSALAALVDYRVVPERLTPGWEKVVSPRSIGLAYAVMALTLAACGHRAARGKAP